MLTVALPWLACRWRRVICISQAYFPACRGEHTGLGRAAGTGQPWLSVDRAVGRSPRGLFFDAKACAWSHSWFFLPTLASACSVWFLHLSSLQFLEKLPWVWIPEGRARWIYIPLSHSLSNYAAQELCVLLPHKPL